MCPEKAGIFIADDDMELVNMIKELLQFDGHRVLVTSYTLDDALLKISQLTKDVQVALLDGNLSRMDTSGLDGLTMVRAIHENVPWVKTVGISASGKVVGADANFHKGRDSLNELTETINNL